MRGKDVDAFRRVSAELLGMKGGELRQHRIADRLDHALERFTGDIRPRQRLPISDGAVEKLTCTTSGSAVPPLVCGMFERLAQRNAERIETDTDDLRLRRGQCYRGEADAQLCGKTDERRRGLSCGPRLCPICRSSSGAPGRAGRLVPSTGRSAPSVERPNPSGSCGAGIVRGRPAPAK